MAGSLLRSSLIPWSRERGSGAVHVLSAAQRPCGSSLSWVQSRGGPGQVVVEAATAPPPAARVASTLGSATRFWGKSRCCWFLPVCSARTAPSLPRTWVTCTRTSALLVALRGALANLEGWTRPVASMLPLMGSERDRTNPAAGAGALLEGGADPKGACSRSAPPGPALRLSGARLRLP